MKIALFILFLSTYLVVRKVWFNYRKIRAVSSIERITLSMFSPDIILPEVKVEYKYYSHSGVYFGSGIMPISKFLGDQQFVLYLNENNLPVLEIEGQKSLADGKYISEEQIEHFLLTNYNSIIIFIDPVEPFHSKIDCLNQNILEIA